MFDRRKSLRALVAAEDWTALGLRLGMLDQALRTEAVALRDLATHSQTAFQALERLLRRYPRLDTLVWAQEETLNQGGPDASYVVSFFLSSVSLKKSKRADPRTPRLPAIASRLMEAPRPYEAACTAMRTAVPLTGYPCSV